MNRILLAYDGSEPAVRALDTTVELATKFGAFVGVISVVEGPGLTNPRPHPSLRGARTRRPDRRVVGSSIA